MASPSKYSRGPGDSILALLEPGEYVLIRNADDEIGKKNLDELNFEDAPRFDMSKRGQFQAGGMLGDMMGYQNGGSAEQSLMDMVNRAKQAQTEQDSLNILYSQPMDRFSPDESFTREVLLRNLGLPQETSIDTLSHRGNDIDLRLSTPSGGSHKYERRGNLTDKREELSQKISQSESNLRSDISSARKGFRSNYPKANKALQYDILKEEYQGALDKLRAGYVDMDAFERMDYETDERDGFQMGGILGMQAGGALEYGGATTETQNLEDIYKNLNMQPISQQRPGFEKQYTYDASREGALFEDYARAISGATQSGRQNLMGAGQQMQQAQAKAGFAGAGAGQQAQKQARGNIMQDFLAQEGAAKSSLFKGVRGERESWAADVAAGLSRLDADEGTEEYGAGYTASVPDTTPAAGAGPPGWPSQAAYDQWVSSGGDENNKHVYGWQDPGTVVSTGTCFLSGTKVDIVDDKISIEDLQIGDEVKTYDLKNKNHKKSKVTETYKHNVYGYLIINNIIKTTPNHPFYSDG